MRFLKKIVLAAAGAMAMVGLASTASAAGVTIYYDNSATAFPTVNIHYWSNPSSTWPGVKMTQVDTNIWEYTFPSDTSGLDGFLFCDGNSNGGNGHQTGDCKLKPQEGHLYKGANSNKGAVTDQGLYSGATGPKPSVTANPASGTKFSDNVTVTLTVSPAVDIYYTIDGTAPGKTSKKYSGALTFTESTTLKTYVENENGSKTQEFIYTKRSVVVQNGNSINTDYYKVNPDGKTGSNRTVNMKFTKVSNDNRICVADNALSNWTDADLICQGVARDIASAYKGKHEYPVIDSYAIYAAYDKDNLYLGIQYVDLVWDLYGDGKPDNLRAKPYQMDGRIMLAFDLDPFESFEGVLANGNTIWDADGKYNTFDNGTDCIFLGSTKPTVGTPGLFFPDANGKASYDAAYCKSVPAPFYGLQDGLLPSINHLWGQERFEGDPEDLLGNDGFVDLIGEIGKDKHTFYEFRFPLATLGITEDYIKNTGIGVMVVDTYGQGAIGSTPYDPTVLDNAKKSYSKDASSSMEKEDTDIFTYSHARIGKLSTTGIEMPVAEPEFDSNAQPEYYTLQGVRVANPTNGLYIVRKGNKSSKIMVK